MVQIKSNFNFAFRAVKVHNFAESCREIIANRRILRCTFHSLFIFFYRLCKLACSKMSVSFIFVLVRQAVVLVGKSVFFLLFELPRFEQTLRLLVVMLKLRRLELFNCGSVIPLFLICLSAPRQCLCAIFEWCFVRCPYLHCRFAHFNALVKIVLGEINCRLVCQECHVSAVQLNGLVVGCQRPSKVFGLIKLISPLLGCNGGFFIFFLLG
mmetsp:Transcript_9398/g.13591  ORF Transcript_9398/g.13591 Transcript_9398/m.13591 type:complete len:211 (+) Transcript_9398:1320-1952(+)